METVVSVRDLRVWYRDNERNPREVLAGVNLDLKKGEILGIAGRSGSGKTTLALAILRALPEGSSMLGTVEFAGRRMAPVFQEATGALHPMMTIGAQISEVLRTVNRAARKERAIAALESTGLAADCYDAWPHELSGGQKQRALIAQALAAEPDVLIADEPTASVDTATQAAILDVLRGLQHRLGMAMLLISHSPALLEGLAGRVLTMRDGLLCV